MTIRAIPNGPSTHPNFPITESDVSAFLGSRPLIPNCLDRTIHNVCSLRLKDATAPLRLCRGQVLLALGPLRQERAKGEKITTLFAKSVYLKQIFTKLIENTLTNEELEGLNGFDLGLRFVKRETPSNLSFLPFYVVEYQLQTTQPLTGILKDFAEVYEYRANLTSQLERRLESVSRRCLTDSPTASPEEPLVRMSRSKKERSLQPKFEQTRYNLRTRSSQRK